MADWEKEHERYNIEQDRLDAEQKELRAGGSTPTTTTTTTQVPPTPKNQETEALRRVQEDKELSVSQQRYELAAKHRDEERSSIPIAASANNSLKTE